VHPCYPRVIRPIARISSFSMPGTNVVGHWSVIELGHSGLQLARIPFRRSPTPDPRRVSQIPVEARPKAVPVLTVSGVLVRFDVALCQAAAAAARLHRPCHSVLHLYPIVHDLSSDTIRTFHQPQTGSLMPRYDAPGPSIAKPFTNPTTTIPTTKYYVVLEPPSRGDGQVEFSLFRVEMFRKYSLVYSTRASASAFT